LAWKRQEQLRFPRIPQNPRGGEKEKRRKLFPIRLTDFKTLRDWTCFDADTGKDLAVEVREYFIPDFSNWKNHDAFESAFARLKKDLEAENSKKVTESLIASLTGHGAGANILTNSGLNHFDSRRTVSLDASHAGSVLGTNATALTLAVARFKERWPQIQLDYDPILLSPKSVLPRLGYSTAR